jgi:pimeloyl-ACP methyl ester carboxylesterase
MQRYATSADETRIAFDRLGEGPPLIIVSGILCDRRKTRALAARLSHTFSVIHYDRRGRGDSGDSPHYAVQREVDDLAALIVEAGGTAAIYGHSSGAGLALNAAASGLPITRLVLHEPPYGPDDDESRRGSRELGTAIKNLLAADRRAEAIDLFMTSAGVPAEMVQEMIADPLNVAMAPTMMYDIEVMGEISNGGSIPEGLVRSVTTPTLAIAGSASPEFFRATVDRLVELLPNGTLAVLEGHDHGAPPDVVAAAVLPFVAGAA